MGSLAKLGALAALSPSLLGLPHRPQALVSQGPFKHFPASSAWQWPGDSCFCPGH